MKNVFDDISKNVCNSKFINWNKYRSKTIFITGGTGLIGYTLIRSLVYTSQLLGLNIKVIALVRNMKKATLRFSDLCYTNEDLIFLEGTVEELPFVSEKIDYIVHGAGKTASMDFVKSPVETIETIILGTNNLLKLAKEKKVIGFVFLSTMEVYGYPEKGRKVVESDIGLLSPLEVRNCYPISKIVCENLCKSYADEYNIPISIARLTQTFGPGVDYYDARLFGYLGRCIYEKQDIVLKTLGLTERSYLHTLDAVTAILLLLIKGEVGEAYNVADEDTYCSVADFAEMLATENNLNVTYDLQPSSNTGFANTLYMDLSTQKLKSLGWKVQFNGGIVEMINSMLQSFEARNK